MAKLLWVGPNHNNTGGMSSKAYTVRRSGKTVVVRWGPVESVGGGGGKLRWQVRELRKQIHRFRSEEAARQFSKQRIEQKLDLGYERLPGRVRISASRA